MIIYGVNSKMEKEMWAGADVCPVCGVTRDRFIARKRIAPALFYIPLVWISTGRYLITCENCETGTKLKKKEYNEVRSRMTDAFRKEQFPAYVANQYFSAKALGRTGKIVRVVFAWIWALLAGFVAVTQAADAFLFASNGMPETQGLVVAAAALILGVIPVIMAHKELSRVNKLLKTAQLYEGRIDVHAAEEKMASEVAAPEAAVSTAEAVTPAAE